MNSNTDTPQQNLSVNQNNKSYYDNVSHESKNLQVETHETNFGHESIIWETKNGNILENNKVVPSDKRYKTKQHLVLNAVNEITETKDAHFQLFKYTYGTEKKIPMMNDSPTLCLSLFMPNSNLYNSNGNFGEWTSKYFANQVLLCCIFASFLKKCNIRIYFDWYMLNAFYKLKGDDDSLKIYRNTGGTLMFIDRYLQSDYILSSKEYLLESLREADKMEFKNGLERFIYSYNIIENISDVTFEFYGFKFGRPFLENYGSINEGHITNAYIGSIIRFFPLRQKEYTLRGIKVSPPIHLVWRDAHTTLSATIDIEWIKKFHECTKDKEIYFLPNSRHYVQSWHDLAFSRVYNEHYTKSTSAGLIQIANSTINTKNDLYLATIGMPFILYNEEPLLKNHRPEGKHYSNNRPIREFDYGIDEYVLSGFFDINYFKKRSLYFPYTSTHEYPYFDQVVSNAPLNVQFNEKAATFLLIYMVDNKMLDGRIPLSLMLILDKFEELREMNEYTNPLVGFLLHFISNKFTTQFTLFNNNKYNEVHFNMRWCVDTLRDKLIETNQGFYLELSKGSLHAAGLYPQSGIIYGSPVEWTSKLYEDRSAPTLYDYDPADFYSGYYYTKPPSLDIGIMRHPGDMEYCIECLEKNKLSLPLNKTSYKLEVESKNLSDYMRENYNSPSFSIVELILNFNETTKEIKNKLLDLLDPPDAQNLHGDTYDKYIANVKEENRKLLLHCIWKALNFYGYDVPVHLLNKKLYFLEEEKYYVFNEYVKELASVDNWADTAISIMMTDNKHLWKFIDEYKTYNDDKNTMYESIRNKITNIKESFKMETFGGNTNYVYYLLITILIIFIIIMIWLLWNSNVAEYTPNYYMLNYIPTYRADIVA